MKSKKKLLLILLLAYALLYGCTQQKEDYTSKVNVSNITAELSKDYSNISILNDTIITLPHTDKLYYLRCNKDLKSELKYLSELSEFVEWFEISSDNVENISYNYLKDGEIIGYEKKQNDITQTPYSLSVPRERDTFGNDIYVSLLSGAFAAQDSTILSEEYMPKKIESFCFFENDKSKYAHFHTAKEKADKTLDRIRSEIPFILPKDIEFVPYCCTVYNVNDMNEYNITYVPTYKNANLDSCVSYVYYDENGEAVSADENASTLNVLIDTNDKIYRVMSPYSMKFTEEKEIDKCLDLNSAFSIVNDSISDDIQLNIDTAELIYSYRDIYDDDRKTIKYAQCRPVWKLVSADTGIAEYPSLAFLVDAVTGELKTYIPAEPW